MVGLFLLNQLKDLGINIGLYRDDGLAICNKKPREIELIKKKICQIFKNNGLKITIEANKKVVNFLDVTLNLRSGTYKPYIKENNVPRYVHKQSNHPPAILKNIPDSINDRLLKNSSDETSFNEIAPIYNEALNKSGYAHKLTYKPETSERQNKNKNRARHRKITWFNAPYSANVETSIGKLFFKLIDKCFPKSNTLHKIINRNTIKLSYSCMPNIEQIISGHNKNILNRDGNENREPKMCNCRKPTECPLDNKCLTKSIIYQAEANKKSNNTKETYVGLTDNTFKTRFTKHKFSFNNKKDRKSTKLSDYIWKLKEENEDFDIKWNILSGPLKSYSPESKYCNLCNEEKFYIISQPNLGSLNERNELTFICRHRRKHLLCNT